MTRIILPSTYPHLPLRPMSNRLVILILALVLLPSGYLFAEEEGPPISIKSPDTAVTFAYGSIKDRALIWKKKDKVLVARVTFTDAQQNNGQANDDTHEFKLPGVCLDETKGLFYAVTPKG